MPGKDELVSYLLGHEQEMVSELRELVELESPTTDKALLDTAAGWIADRAAGIEGCSAQIVKQDRAGNLVRIERAGSSGEKPVFLLGHFDTVWPQGTLKRLPFRVEGGKAYGPGSFDMKGGLIQGLWALRGLAHASVKTPVVMLCNSNEEIGSPGTREIIEKEAAKSSAVLVLEPSKDGMLKTSRKGAGVFTVKATGKAAHAGLDPTKGVSAIEELSRLVVDLHSLIDLQVGTTVNVGVVHGGTRANVVAQEASAEVDVRVPNKAEAGRLEVRLHGMKPHDPRVRLEVSGEIRHPPMERTGASAKLFGVAQRLAAEVHERLEECSVGGASDGNFCSALGVPTLDGLGAVGAGAHADDEHLLVAQMPKRAAIVSGLIGEVSAALT